MKIIDEILRKKIMKSRKKRNTLMTRKHRPLEVMQATEQQQENCRMMSPDMLLEILSWLPVKSLLRFRCVSKLWKTLISSDSFRKLHSEKHSSSPPLLIANYCSIDYIKPWKKFRNYLVTFDQDGKCIEKITLPFPSSIFTMTSVPHQSKLLGFNSQSDDFYFYNPSTRQIFQLTNPSCYSSPQYQKNYSATYGYIPSKDEYIMVHLVKSNDKLYCEVLVNISISNDNFKLHYNQWRSIESPIMIDGVTSRGIYVAGAFYWLSRCKQNSENKFILSFEVESECISSISCPEDLIDFGALLLNLKDELYFVNFPESPPVLLVWKLSSESKLWTPYWKFDIKELFGLPRGATCDMRHFNMEIFLYQLKYFKGYDQQPRDDEISDEMGQVYLGDGYDQMPLCFVDAHTNLFTL